MNPEKFDPHTEGYFNDPMVDPPPLGKKILCLTPAMVAVIGIWEKEYIGWKGLPKIPKEIRERGYR